MIPIFLNSVGTTPTVNFLMLVSFSNVLRMWLLPRNAVKTVYQVFVDFYYSRTSELRNPRESRVSVSLKFP